MKRKAKAERTSGVDVQGRLTAAISAKVAFYQSKRALVARVDEETFLLGVEMFSNAEGLLDWLISPLTAFGGEAPLDKMRTAKGREEVKDVIRAIGHGNFM